MNCLRRSEYVPPMAKSESRSLRGLPASWGQPIVESTVESLQRRGFALVATLRRAGRTSEAAELRRRIALLERADELQRHASDLETVAGLYRALATFAHEQELPAEHERTWAQAGVLEDPLSVVHGPAFRETATLRNRAYRLLAASVARSGRLPARNAL
jgi:hypothetical protein